MPDQPAGLATRPELFAMVGGAAGIAAAMADFHRRLLADPLLAPAFAGIDLDALRRHHEELITFILGGAGPQPISGRGLRQAHHHRGITIAQFDALVGHLVASLVTEGVSPADLAEVVKRVMWLQPHIVSVGSA